MSQMRKGTRDNSLTSDHPLEKARRAVGFPPDVIDKLRGPTNWSTKRSGGFVFPEDEEAHRETMADIPVAVVTKSKHTLETNLYAYHQMLRAQAIPGDAKCQIHIPGGGDYSNMTLDPADFECTVTWES